jgi:hypothetical protein
MNAMLAKMTRHDFDRLKQLNDVEAPVGRKLSLYEVKASMLLNESWTDELFDTPESHKA